MKKITAFMLSAAMISAYAVNVSAVEVTYKTYVADETIATRKYANTDYVFDVSGEKFTLLETFDDENSKYLVIANKTYGSRSLKKDSFTSDEDSALNNWLNSEFISDSYTKAKLNDNILKHIDKNHVWKLDPSDNISEGTTITAGITLPSVSEMIAYGSIMGYNDPGEKYGTRTQVTGGGTKCMAICDPSNNGTDTTWNITNKGVQNIALRPIFYLDDDFFAQTKIDLTLAGTKVKDEIKKIDTQTLLKIYDVNYLIENLGIEPPEGYISIKNAKIKTLSKENVKNGETLLAEFEYDSENEYDMASASVIWERVSADSEEEVGKGDSYIVTEADTINGKYSIRFKLLVTDTEGNSTECYSEETAKIPAISTKSWGNNTRITMPLNAENMDYKFKYNGLTFTIVDTLNNDKSTFFIAPNDDYGRIGMTISDFDPNNAKSMAYTMNTTFVKDGLGSNALPDELLKYIDFDHMWVCDAAPLSINEKVHESYAFKAGVTLLSFTEIEKYKDALATTDNLKGYSRTASNYNNEKDDTDYAFNIQQNDSGVNTNIWNLNGTYNYVKPVFYLGKDFFKEVKIDLDSVGTKALEMLGKVYTIEDLKGLYSEELLEAKGFKYNYELSASFSGKNGGEALLSGKITSNVAGEHSRILILCVYDENGAAVASKAVKVDFNGKETQSISLSAGNLADGKYSAKAMLWDDLYNANAQMACAEY